MANLSLAQLTARIAEITSGPPAELVEAVVRALEAHRGDPLEVQARAAIAAIGEADSWRPVATAPVAAGSASTGS